MAPKSEPETITQRLRVALRADSEAPLVELLPVLEEQLVTLGDLVVKLPEQGIKDLRRMVAYADACKRFREGRLFVPHGVTAIVRAKREGRELLPQPGRPASWASLAEVRRRLIGFLDQLPPAERFDPIKKAEAARLLGWKRADSLSKFIAAVKDGKFPRWAHGHEGEVKALLRENSIAQLDRERIMTLSKLKATLLPAKH